MRGPTDEATKAGLDLVGKDADFAARAAAAAPVEVATADPILATAMLTNETMTRTSDLIKT